MGTHARAQVAQARHAGARASLRGVWLLAAALLAIGLVARVAPLLAGEQRLLRQFPSEDGYLMLTIARNLALGHGLSTADGTIATNGTQPLISFVFAAGHWLAGGDRIAGVVFALVFELLVACAGAWVVYATALRALGEGARATAALACGVWFASVLGVMHTMNCLETGAYAVGVMLFLHALLGRSGDPFERWGVRRALGLGAALGVLFWVRNDAVFLIAAVCVLRALLGPERRLQVARASLVEACLAGLASIAVASPWLIFNHVRFGSIVPVSGRAEASFAEGLGSNLAQLPASLSEYALAVVPIPLALERHPMVVVAGALLALGALALALRAARRGDARRFAFVAVLVVYALGLCGYYGLFFGVPYFLTRYLFPLAAPLAILWAAAALGVLERMPVAVRPAVRMSAALALLALVLYPNVRLWRHGNEHMHFQCVEWVERNVRDDEWIGAFQTGTVGYFHDRTINLDGKVNPEAFVARNADAVPSYVLGKPIRYLVDWMRQPDFTTDPQYLARFDVLVRDPVLNLAVLRRKDG